MRAISSAAAQLSLWFVAVCTFAGMKKNEVVSEPPAPVTKSPTKAKKPKQPEPAPVTQEPVVEKRQIYKEEAAAETSPAKSRPVTSSLYSKKSQKSSIDAMVAGKSPNKARLQSARQSPPKKRASPTKTVVAEPAPVQSASSEIQTFARPQSNGVTMMKKTKKQSQ